MEPNEDEILSYLSIARNLEVLRRVGIFPLASSTSKIKKKLHTIFRYLNISLLSIYTVLQVTYIYTVRSDLNAVIDAGYLLLTFCDCICKQVIFLRHSDRILNLLNMMKDPSFNQGLYEHRPFLMRTIRHSRFLLMLYNNICYALTLLWAILPIIPFVRHGKAVFTIWVPFDYTKKSNFYIVLFYQYIHTTWLGQNNSTMDLLIVFLYAQIKTQISILRLNLENLVSRSREEAESTSRSFNKVLEFRFRGILNHYNKIIEFAQIAEELFNFPILFQFFASGAIICSSAYRTVGMNFLSGDFLTMVMYLFCIFSELFLYCFYGNEAAYESERVIESAYCMEWEELPVKNRRELLIFMERIKCFISPKVGKIIPLSVNTFVQIVKTSYTFYTFLSNSM